MSSRFAEGADAGLYGWFVVIALTVVNLVASIDRFMMGIVVVPLKGALGLSDAQLGVVYGLGFAILYCVAGIPFGWLSSSINRRRAIIYGCLLWTVATALCSLAESFEQLFLMRIAVGLGEAALVPAAISLINAYMPGRHLGIANGMFFSGGSVGKAVAFIGGGAILAAITAGGGFAFAGRHFHPWQALFLFAALPGVLALVLMAFVREPVRHASVKPPPFGELMNHVAGQWRGYGYVVSGSCALHLSALALAAWAPSFYVRHFNLGIAPAATMVGIIGITSGLVGAIGGGFVTDRLNRLGIRGAPLLVPAVALLVAIPAALVAFHLAPGLVWSAAAYAVLQCMMLIGGPQTFAAIQRMTPHAHRGFSAAILLAVVSLVAMGAGPVIIGLLSDRVFVGLADSLGPSLAVSIVLECLAGGLLLLAGRDAFERASQAVVRQDIARAERGGGVHPEIAGDLAALPAGVGAKGH